MVTPACYASTEVGRRYSRGCPPYSLGAYHAERRYPLPSHHDSRTSSMTERDSDDASHPRKRIAVACGRCRKRKIRCSGDSGNGGPCSNCKNAGHEPCLFLRVSSTETHLRENEYAYNVESGRAYHARGGVSPVAVSPYSAADMAPGGGDFSPYRPNGGYTYGTAKNGGGYYGVSGWAGAYADDAADYNLGYSSYPHLAHDPVQQLVQQQQQPPPGYHHRYGAASSKGASGASAAAAAAAALYAADPDAASSYSYSNLVHRPAGVTAAAAAAAANELPQFSLAGMAASLPASDRLAPPTTPQRLASGGGGPYVGGKSASAGGGASSLPDTPVAGAGGYGGFDSPVPYPAAPATLPSNLTAPTRGGGDGATAADALYGPPPPPEYRASAHDVAGSYVYTDSSKLSSSSNGGGGGGRRDSQTSSSGGTGGSSSSSGGHSGSVLSNGQVYVPESHHAHAHAHHAHHLQHHHPHRHPAAAAAALHHHHGLPASSQAYVVSAAAAAGGGASSHAGSETPGHHHGASSSGGAMLDGHRRSVGSLQRGV